MEVCWSSVFLLPFLVIVIMKAVHVQDRCWVGSRLDQPLCQHFRQRAGEKKEGQWGPSQLCQFYLSTFPQSAIPHCGHIWLACAYSFTLSCKKVGSDSPLVCWIAVLSKTESLFLRMRGKWKLESTGILSLHYILRWSRDNEVIFRRIRHLFTNHSLSFLVIYSFTGRLKSPGSKPESMSGTPAFSSQAEWLEPPCWLSYACIL